MSHSIQDIAFKNSKGVATSLKNFKAKAFLIVNVASKCGLTPQYEALQKLYKNYHDKGLEILAFPANEFLGQEPGTNQEIQDFCNLTPPQASGGCSRGRAGRRRTVRRRFRTS